MTEVDRPELTSQALTYATPPAPVAVHRLTIVLLVCIGASILSFSAWGIAYGLVADEWTKYGAGIASPTMEISLSEWLLPFAHIAAPISVAVLAICLLTWVHRANRKLRSLGVSKLWYTPFRAVIYWVTPYQCLIAPFHIMKELYAVSRGIARNTFTPLVGFWWAFWLLANLMYLVAITAGTQRSEGETEAQFAADWAMWHLFPAPLYVTSGLLLMCIVWQVDRALERRTLTRAA